MSVTEQINNLKEKRESLESMIKFTSLDLRKLKSRRSNCNDILGWRLKSKSSPLALAMRNDYKIELASINKEIKEKELEQKRLKEELEATEKELEEKLNDTTLYIEEQTTLMVESFLEYLKCNTRSIALCSEPIFWLKSCEYTDVDCNDWDYIKFDNQIKLCWFLSGKNIHTSDKFYFTNPKFVVYESNHPSTEASHTEWFSLFFKRFSSAFYEKLRKRFSLSEFTENFKLTIIKKPNLTIDNPGFTIELL